MTYQMEARNSNPRNKETNEPGLTPAAHVHAPPACSLAAPPTPALATRAPSAIFLLRVLLSYALQLSAFTRSGLGMYTRHGHTHDGPNRRRRRTYPSTAYPPYGRRGSEYAAIAGGRGNPSTSSGAGEPLAHPVRAQMYGCAYRRCAGADVGVHGTNAGAAASTAAPTSPDQPPQRSLFPTPALLCFCIRRGCRVLQPLSTQRIHFRATGYGPTSRICELWARAADIGRRGQPQTQAEMWSAATDRGRNGRRRGNGYAVPVLRAQKGERAQCSASHTGVAAVICASKPILRGSMCSGGDYGEMSAGTDGRRVRIHVWAAAQVRGRRGSHLEARAL
ncbi:hypothetical protein C8R44DRAFT_746002 [Mycena epipterygia]|nr:hypothetical protein C8R44DRAFT_746002 [Mycena epipterygia]